MRGVNLTMAAAVAGRTHVLPFTLHVKPCGQQKELVWQQTAYKQNKQHQTAYKQNKQHQTA